MWGDDKIWQIQCEQRVGVDRWLFGEDIETRAAEPDRFQKPKKCTVCSEEYSTGAQDGLCWVCRRLKLSAWKDADSQMPASD